MKQNILSLLKSLEKEKNIKILLAVESGSREWGFASDDSDYDVRCIHVSKIDKYLSLDTPSAQVDLMKDEIDIVSWDVKKFFSLFLKSNPTVSEWLSSKIVYINNKINGFNQKQLREIFDLGFSRYAIKKHYINLAKENYYKYIKDKNEVSLKKYVYILRALGCVEFIQKTNSLPPLDWKESSIYLPDKIKDFFSNVVKSKKSSEKNIGIREKRIDDYIESCFNIDFDKSLSNFDKEKINNIVINAIKEK